MSPERKAELRKILDEEIATGAAAEARGYERGVLEGLQQALRITTYLRYISTDRGFVSALDDMDVHLKGNIARGGFDSTTPLDDR